MNHLAGERLRRSLKPWEPRDARDSYLASAVSAWMFLFGDADGPPPDVFDQRFRTACDLYNYGLGWVLSGRRSTNALAVLAGGMRLRLHGGLDVGDQCMQHPMTMKLVALNIAMPQTVSHQGKLITTGIFKEPVDRRVRMGKLGIEGDGQADLTVHGGEHKAAYAYPFEHYASWERELGRNDFRFGQFGENLTVTGLSEETVCVGDIFRVGAALVEVTQPRVPCFKLALRMGLPEFPKQFLQSGRSGFYLRVLDEGAIGAGDEIVRVGIGPEQMSIRSLLNLVYFEHENVEGAAKALRIPALSPGWRETIEARLKATQEPP